MKTLVIYDSNFGNTKLVAEEIAKDIGGDIKAASVKQFDDLSLDDVELLIVGSPINGWRPTDAILLFLHSLKDKLKPGLMFTSFDTRVKLFIHGDAKNKIANTLMGYGAQLIVEPQAFCVIGKNGPLCKGELEKVSVWAKMIKSKIL